MSAPLIERSLPTPEPTPAQIVVGRHLRLVVSNPVVPEIPVPEIPALTTRTPLRETPAETTEPRPVFVSPRRTRRAGRLVSAFTAAILPLTAACTGDDRTLPEMNTVYEQQQAYREGYIDGRAAGESAASKTKTPTTTPEKKPTHHAEPDPEPRPSPSEAPKDATISGFVTEISAFVDTQRTLRENGTEDQSAQEYRDNHFYDNVTGDLAIIYSGRVDDLSGEGSQQFRSYRVQATQNGAIISCNVGATQHSSDYLEQYTLAPNGSGGWDITANRAKTLTYDGYGGYDIDYKDEVTETNITSGNQPFKDMQELFNRANAEAGYPETSDDLVNNPFPVKGASCV